MTVSENYQTFVDVMAGVSVTDIVLDDGLRQRLIKELRVKEGCPRCGSLLFMSDLPDYDYVCPYCDESFYAVEV